MNKCRLKVQQEISDLLMRKSNLDKESQKVYIKGSIFQHIGEGAAENVEILVDTTHPEKYLIQAEVWTFSREDLLTLLTSGDRTRGSLVNQLLYERDVESKLLESKELIKFEEL